MTPCMLVGSLVVALAPQGQFTLQWMHSVEKEAWREEWRLTDEGLLLTGAAVRGSGAGMEPGPGGRFEGDWWVWTPEARPVPELVLAASGATMSGWTLCGRDCTTIGTTPGLPIRIRPCEN